MFEISAKALRIASVGPVTVTILSGHEPSEMLILAPLYNDDIKSVEREKRRQQDMMSLGVMWGVFWELVEGYSFHEIGEEKSVS